jgi:lipopolysaccharide/colanic/teichoic acid biosynthesis glycosyltransferase
VARAATHEFERSGYTAIRFTENDGDGIPGQPLRTISRASRVIAETKPVRIVVCLRSPLEELPLCELLEQQIGGVPVETGHEAYERLTGKIFLDERTTLHLLLSHAGLSNRVYGTTKRFVSSVVAAMALVVALPVMALIALSIYVTEGRPVLFVHERVGLHGRPFRLLKFRSMRAANRKSSEWECDNEERITPLGRWLRKLHLDELPQLWNILRGDMDLVGPRPHPVSNHELLARAIPYYSLRSLVRPGLTGWAQVRQGYAHDVPGEIEKMRYDLCAIARPSLLRDLRVVLTTAKIVLVGPPLDREASPVAKTTDREGSVQWPLKGFARPLVSAVVVLFIASGTLRLMAQIWVNTRPMLMPPATAMARKSPEPTSPPTTAATRPPDPASLDAAAARAKAAVQRYEITNARILESVLAKRIDPGTFVDGIEQPRYQAEVQVEIPRRFDKPIRRKYFVTLQYVGSGEWEIDRAVFATRY